ncbi:MAG: RluA family pseudouridine synthase [Polyangiales bacterium]
MSRAPASPPPGCHPDSIVLRFPVPPELHGWRLDHFIQRQIPRLSRSRAHAIVRACARHADGRRRRPGQRVQRGEVVLLVRQRFEEPAAPLAFAVYYEDDDILVVDKPAGLPVHPSATYHRHTLSYQLAQRYPAIRPQITHRLDRETSGLVVCAKHRDAERTLKRAFEARLVDKGYRAIIRGRLRPQAGEFDAPLKAQAQALLHMCMQVTTPDDPNGLAASTAYRIEACAPAHSLVALKPRTGRQHQLRVHLAAAGHAIVGDKLYGDRGAQVFVDYIDAGMTPALLAELGHPRHALHAAEIAFLHPRHATPVHFTAPLPSDMQQLWQDCLAAASKRASSSPAGDSTA